MPFTDNGGVRLHWDETGEGSPILLVMGHLYSAAMWYPAVPALSAEHRVIRFDNRGVGRSDTTGKVTIQQLAQDAFKVLDAAGVRRAHVYGVSMGGVIVQEMALQHPERILSLIVGCSGALTPDKPRAPAILRALYHLPRPLLARLASLGGDHGYGAAATAEAVAADRVVLAADRFTPRGAAAQAAAIAGYRVTPEAIACLTMPALVLHGDEDRTVKFAWGEELAALLPDSRFVRIAGAGHNFLVADPDRANRAVLDFIRRVDLADGVATHTESIPSIDPSIDPKSSLAS